MKYLFFLTLKLLEGISLFFKVFLIVFLLILENE